jgi:hypothetical protein
MPALVVVAPVVAAHALVTAGAEGEVAGAGEDDDADAGIELRPVHGIHQLLDGFGAKGIAPFGPIDDNAGDAFGSVVTDVAVGVVGDERLPC